MRIATTTPDRKKFETIQVLRFIAALMVLVMHAGIFTGDRLVEGLKPFTPGANGVTLFFVISGFVMIVSSQSLLKNPDGWRIFAGKRILRIVPIYWLLTTLKVILLLAGTGAILHAKLDWIYIIKSYLFIPATNFQNGIRPLVGVGWTLNYEMFFYLLFCLALFFRIKPLVFLTITILPLFLGSFFRSPSWSAIPDFYFDPVLLNFLFGVVAGTLIMKGRKIPHAWCLPLMIVGMVILLIPATYTRMTEIEINLVYGVMAFLVIYGAASMEKIGQRAMPKSLVYMGAASYSLYLIHPMIGPIVPALLAKINFRQPAVSILGVIAVSLVAGWAFYKYVENPMTLALERLRKNRKLSLKEFSFAVKHKLGLDHSEQRSDREQRA